MCDGVGTAFSVVTFGMEGGFPWASKVHAPCGPRKSGMPAEVSNAQDVNRDV